MNLPLTAPFDAFSISASSHTMNGSLPPNSSTHFFICDVALCATLAPASKQKRRDYNEQHLHDMHNSLFRGLIGGSGTRREGMHVGNLLTQLTTFIHQQHQQIQALIDEIRKNVNQINDQMQSQLSLASNTNQQFFLKNMIYWKVRFGHLSCVLYATCKATKQVFFQTLIFK